MSNGKILVTFQPEWNAMVRQTRNTSRKIDRDRVIRAVASSSAIETGESTEAIEKRLKSGKRRFPGLELAN